MIEEDALLYSVI